MYILYIIVLKIKLITNLHALSVAIHVPPNTGQLPFSLPHGNPMEQSPNQLPQKLPILKYTRQREIEVLSGVFYIHQPMLPAKCYRFNVAKTNAAISLERVKKCTA